MRLTAVAAVALGLVLAGPVGAAVPRTSLPVIERQVMCVTCKIPLDVAESPQANDERAYIQELIDRGLNETQIKRTLVAQYGQNVLALPSTHGFDLAAYLVPIIAVLALIAMLAVLLPRWRLRAREQSRRRDPMPVLSSAESARLEADLEHFD
jgi:cytochrome c-type biogenesis protein CcmH